MWPRALAVAVLTFAASGCGPDPDPSVVAATMVSACVKAHGMAGPYERVDPPPPILRGAPTTVFRSCEWPAPYVQHGRYSVNDGYAEIRVSHEQWAGKAEVTNASAPDRVEVPCAEVELRYTFAKQGPTTLLEPIRFISGTHAMIGGQPFTDVLPFPIADPDVVVVHNLSYSIVSARCVR